MPRWLRWAVLANGALLALLGATHLVVTLVLPRLLLAWERAQGIGIFDPALGVDPVLARPHDPVRVTVAAILLCCGLAHVAAGALYRKSSKRVLVALLAVGALSLVPTSVGFAVLALATLGRSTDGNRRAP